MNSHECRGRPLAKGNNHADVAQRPNQKRQINVERNEIADRNLTRQNSMATNTENTDGPERGQNIDRRHEIAANLRGLH